MSQLPSICPMRVKRRNFSGSTSGYQNLDYVCLIGDAREGASFYRSPGNRQAYLYCRITCLGLKRLTQSLKEMYACAPQTNPDGAHLPVRVHELALALVGERVAHPLVHS